jgi:hypothetical protein
VKLCASTLITTDEELDLAMREADVAIRLRQPTNIATTETAAIEPHIISYSISQ